MNDFMTFDFPISRITTACFVPSGRGTPVHANRSSHGLAFYTGGESCFIFDGKKFHVGKNEMIYLPKHSNYVVRTGESISDAGCYVINFDLASSVSFAPFVTKTKNAAHFLSLFRQAEIAWRTRRFGYQMECKGNLYHILFSLQKEFELGYASKHVSDVLLPALTHIHENYTDKLLNIAELASLCRMSETYFRRLFKKNYGVSPIQYIHNLKISRARELIASGMYSISQVSYLSGFHDEAYFSREFKKATSFSPSEYAHSLPL